MASISQFLGALRGGGARPNRFEVQVSFPAFAGGAEDIRQTAFLVQSSSLPGSTLGTITQGFRGRQLKLPGDRTFDTWEATFLNDTDFALRDAFERWHNGINSYRTNQGLTSPDEYLATVSVFQLDAQDNRIKEYTMRYAWPSVIAPIDLAMDSNDAIETFSVTFEYSDLDSSGVSS